jgi:hypothetical protein
MEIQIKETNLNITNHHIVGNIFREILRNESVIDQDKEHFRVERRYEELRDQGKIEITATLRPME